MLERCTTYSDAGDAYEVFYLTQRQVRQANFTADMLAEC
jgi:hypothetical protein